MNRLLVVVSAIVVVAGAICAYVLLVAPDLATADRGILATATAQAATGLLVVAVSWELAAIARTSLATAERQTAAAAEANSQAREAFIAAEVERRLTDLPFVTVMIRGLARGPFGIDFDLVLRNVTEHPALHFTIDPAYSATGGFPFDPAYRQILLKELWVDRGVIGPREEVVLHFGLPHVLQPDGPLGRSVRNMERTWVTEETFDMSPGEYDTVSGHDHIVLELSYVGLTGARVRATAGWNPNMHEPGEDLSQIVTIDPQIPGAPPREIAFPGRDEWDTRLDQQGRPIRDA